MSAVQRSGLVAAVIAFLTASAAAHAAPPCAAVPLVNDRCPSWVSTYDDPSATSFDLPNAMATSPDGSVVFVTGTSADNGAVTAYSASDGAQRWSATFAGDGGDEIPTAIAVSPDGARVFVTAIDSQTFDHYGVHDNIATLAYDAKDGSLLWSHVWSVPGADSQTASPSAIAVSNDGSRVYVAGYSTVYEPDDPPRFTVLAYDSGSGSVQWSLRQHRGGATGIAVSPSGNRVYIAGSYQPLGAFPRYLTMAIEAGDDDHLGEVRWTAANVDENGGSNFAWGLRLSPDGKRVFVSGMQNLFNGVGGKSAMGTVAYDADSGEQLWASTIPAASVTTSGANALAVAPSSDLVFVTGYVFSPGGTIGTRWITAALDAKTGAERWEVPYVEGSYNVPYAIAVAHDSSTVYVTGSSDAVNSPVFGAGLLTTVAYDTATGDRRWVGRASSGTAAIYDAGAAIATTPDGSVFVAGAFMQSGVVVDGVAGADDPGNWAVIRYAQ